MSDEEAHNATELPDFGTREVDKTDSRRERFKGGQKSRAEQALGAGTLRATPSANLDDRRARYSAHEGKRFHSTSNMLFPADSPRYARPSGTARRTFRRRSVNDIFSTLQVTLTIKLPSDEMVTITAPRDAKISDLLREFCTSRSLVLNNFEVIPVKNFFDSFSEDPESQIKQPGDLSTANAAIRSMPVPTTTIMVTSEPEIQSTPAPLKPNTLLAPSDQVTIESLSIIGDLVGEGYTTIMLQEKKTTAKRKLLKKTDRISTGLTEKMTTDLQTEPDEMKQIETTIEGAKWKQIQPQQLPVFGVPLSEACEVGKPPAFIATAFNRLIMDSKLTKFNATNVFTTYFEEAATLEVSKEALMQGSLTVDTLPSSRTVAALLILFLRELGDTLLDSTTYNHLCEANAYECEKWRLSVYQSIMLHLPECNRVTLKFMAEAIIVLSQNESSVADDILTHIARCFAPVVCPIGLDSVSDLKNGKDGKDSKDKRRKSHNQKKLLCTSPTKSNSVLAFTEATKIVKTIIRHHDELLSLELPDITFVMRNGVNIMSEASYDRLLEKLLDSSFREEDFESIVFSTHQYFTPSKELLQSLIDVYESHKDTQEQWQQVRRLSVLSLIKHWVNHWPDILLFDEGYTKTLLQFSKHVKGEKEAENQAIDELQQLVNTQLARNFAKKQDKLASQELDDAIAPVATGDSQEIFFLASAKANVSVVAQQFAAIESELFGKLELSEILFNSWQDPKKAPNFAAVTEWSNGFGHWIQFWLLHNELSERIQRLTFFINLACHSLKIGNYSSAFTIYTALNAIPVSRLKTAWSGLSRSAERNFGLLNQMFDMNGNYSNYRTHLANAKRPAIPYLGIITKDLFSLEENPTQTSRQLLNMYKLRLVYGHIRDIKYYQQVPFEFTGTPISTAHKRTLKAGPKLDREELYQLSLKVQPKDSKPK